MSCSTCNKVAPVMSMGRSGLDYTLKPGVNYISTQSGHNLALNVPVVESPHGPVGGWHVKLFINSQQTEVRGRTAREVFDAASLLLSMNDVLFTEPDLWLNLNIQWLQNQVAKYRIVEVSELLSLATPVEHPAPTSSHQHSQWEEAEWSAKAWGILEMYLIEQPYTFARFVVLIGELQDLYNPSRSPSTGNGRQHIQLIHAVEKLKNFPAYELSAAREWLWSAETLLGITGVDLETFSNNNHWL